MRLTSLWLDCPTPISKLMCWRIVRLNISAVRGCPCCIIAITVHIRTFGHMVSVENKLWYIHIYLNNSFLSRRLLSLLKTNTYWINNLSEQCTCIVHAKSKGSIRPRLSKQILLFDIAWQSSDILQGLYVLVGSSQDSGNPGAQKKQ